MNTLSTFPEAGRRAPEPWIARGKCLVPQPDRGNLAELASLTGAACSAMAPAEREVRLPLWHVRRDTTLLHEGMVSPTVYLVRSGTLKSVKILEDGYEQVLSFAQPGELLGFEALHRGKQTAAVIALEDVTCFALHLAGLPELRLTCPVLDDALQRSLSQQLVRARESAEMMAPVSSDVRLARFLLWTSARMVEAGQSASRLLLRMGRRDIASLLGVAHATVSRSFTALTEGGYIKANNREIEILDLQRLKLRACSTRGVFAEPCARPHPALVSPRSEWGVSP